MSPTHPRNEVVQDRMNTGEQKQGLAIAGSSWDTIREPCLLDAVSWTNKLPHDTDSASLNQASRQDDKASEKRMAIEHHFKGGKKISKGPVLSESHESEGAPRKPNPADTPPSKLRTSQVRSSTPSSRRCQTGPSNGNLYTYARGGASLLTCGPQMASTTRSMNLVSEE